jgi:hypothetical protein
MKMTNSFKLPTALAAMALVLVVLAAGWLASSTGPAQATADDVYINPASAIVAPLDSVSIDLMTDVAPTVLLGSWDVDIAYDSTDLTVGSCTTPVGGCDTTTAGTVSVIGWASPALPAGVTTLATITFTAAASPTGPDALTVTANHYNDKDGNDRLTSVNEINGEIVYGTTAQFVVTMDFNDDNAAAPLITPVCTAGATVTPATATASEGSPATFTVTTFVDATDDCTASAAATANYVVDGTIDCQTPLTLNSGETIACTVLHNNTATFTVTKDFVPDNPATPDPDVTMALTCDSGTVVAVDAGANEEAADTADFTITGFDTGAKCTATETVPAGYSSDETACINQAISVGADTACTITNTANLAWADLDCNLDVNVRDGQYLLTALLGAPISQTAGCPVLGTGNMLPLP